MKELYTDTLSVYLWCKLYGSASRLIVVSRSQTAFSSFIKEEKVVWLRETIKIEEANLQKIINNIM